MINLPWLTIITLFPIGAGCFIPFFPANNQKTIRWYSLGVGITDFLLMIFVFWNFYDLKNTNLQLIDDVEWFSNLAFHWRLGVDGLSIPLLLLTGFITTLAILGSWPVTKNPKLFYFLMLALYSGQIGVFLSRWACSLTRKLNRTLVNLF